MYTIKIAETDNDITRYEQFIAHHPQGHFSQTCAWGKVKKTTGWDYLPVMMEENSEIKAGMLLLVRYVPIPGFRKCIFYSPRGPVADINNLPELRALFAGVATIGRQRGAILLKIDPDVPVSNTEFTANLKHLGWHQNDTGLDFAGVQPKFVFRLDIQPAPEELLANMHSKTRYNIRLADRKGVTVRTAGDKNDLKIFYDILVDTAERDDFLIRDYTYFEAMWTQLVQTGLAEIFIAETEETGPISATLGLIHGRKFWYLYGASSNDHRNLMPNYLIQWYMINWARERGCTLYDFRGVSGDMDETNPLYGLYRFKKGFAGELIEFAGDWDQPYSSFWYTMWSRFLPVYKKILRKRAAQEQKAGS